MEPTRTQQVIEQELREYRALSHLDKEEIIAWWTEHVDEVDPRVEDSVEEAVEVLGNTIQFVSHNDEVNYDVPRRKRIMPSNRQLEDYRHSISNYSVDLEGELKDGGLLEATHRKQQQEIMYGRTETLIRFSQYEEGATPGYVRVIDRAGSFIGFFTQEQAIEWEKKEDRWAKITSDKLLEHRKEMIETKKGLVEHVRNHYVEKIKKCDKYSDIKAIIGDYRKRIPGICWKVLMRVLSSKELDNPYVYPLVRHIPLDEATITEDYLIKLAREKAIFKELNKSITRGEEKVLRIELAGLKLPKTIGQKYFQGFSGPLWDAVEESAWKKKQRKDSNASEEAYNAIRSIISATTNVDVQLELLDGNVIEKETARQATFYAYNNKDVKNFPYVIWKKLRSIAA